MQPKPLPQGPLTDLAPSDWFTDRAHSSIWLRIASMVGASPSRFAEALRGAHVRMKLDAPIAVAFGELRDMKLPVFRFVVHASEDGPTVAHTHISDLTIPTASYWFLATPLRIDGRAGKEGEARALLARVSALIIAHCGQNTMYDTVYEGELELGDGKIHCRSPALRTPRPCDGPFVQAAVWSAIQEVATALVDAPPEHRHRLELALDFFERAVRHEEEFFNYWTALELVANGKAQTIRSRIQQCYSLTSVGDVDRATGFGAIAKWRHEFFHRGMRPLLSSDVARYVQMLFIDLLRSELRLELRGYLASIQEAVGCDLSPLGLPDKRTADQITVTRRGPALATEPGVPLGDA